MDRTSIPSLAIILGWLLIIISIMFIIASILGMFSNYLPLLWLVAVGLNGALGGVLFILMGQSSKALIESSHYIKSLYHLSKSEKQNNNQPHLQGHYKYSFEYKGIQVQHDNMTFNVNSNEFTSADDAKAYIDSLK